jgi:predicted Fe-Mo cluster-binding NifX family protein
MKAAFSCWDNRIAPVFDTARLLWIVEVDSREIIRETEESLPYSEWTHTALHIAEMGVGVLVCGAISGPLHHLIEAYGIRVIPFVAGDLREVIRAWTSNNLDRSLFAMPGCGLRRRHRHRRGAQNGNHPRWGTGKRGVQSGRGRGRGRGGRMFGRQE